MTKNDYRRIEEAIYRGFYREGVVPSRENVAWEDPFFKGILEFLMSTLDDGMDFSEAKDDVWNACDVLRNTLQRIMLGMDDLK